MNTPMNASRCVVVVKEPYIDALVFVRFGGEDGIWNDVYWWVYELVFFLFDVSGTGSFEISVEFFEQPKPDNTRK